MVEQFSFIKRFIAYFVVLLIPILMVGFLYFNNRVQRFDISIKKEQEKEVELKVRQLSDYFRFTESEMFTITQQKYLGELFSEDRATRIHARSYMEDYFSSMVLNSEYYDQIRIVCKDGVEHVRVVKEGERAVIIEPAYFMDISGRYYFEPSLKLNEREVFISRFDLNAEREKISYPVKPVLRFITPIVREGETIGLFIANIKGSAFLKNLRTIGNEYGWETYFLNQKGYYLMGPDPLKEWLSYKDSINAPRFQDDFEGVNILNGGLERNTFLNKQGLFTFFSVDQETFSNSGIGEKNMEEKWFIVSYLSMDKLQKIRKEVFDFKDLMLLISGLLLIVFLSLIFTGNVKKRLEYENQLINSERNLRLANKTKDKFISILAHDLKNPIASIKGFTEIIKGDFENMSQDAQDKVFSAMESATQILVRLIDDVLTWARSQSGSLEVDSEIVFINKVIEDALKLSSLQAVKKDIHLQRNLDYEAFAIADQSMIETVLRNLVGNAIKFSYRGGIVELGLSKAHLDKKVIVSVKDYGIGISSKNQKKLFSLDAVQTTPGTEKETGTGMGLILCKDFIERNGGELWMESSLGKGTTFYFSLPAYEEEDVL